MGITNKDVLKTVLKVPQLEEQMETNTQRIKDITINIKDFESYNTEVGYWDGAIQKAMSLYSNIGFPSGTFKFKQPILMKENTSLVGLSNNMINTVLEFHDCDGLVYLGRLRHIDVKDLKLVLVNTTQNKYAGLKYGGTGSKHYIRYDNVMIYDFNIGIHCDSTAIQWNCMYHNVKVEHADIGFKNENSGGLSFNMQFNEVYFNRCIVALDINSIQAEFNSCNFGITNCNAFTIDNNSYVIFNTCNFECDSQLTDEGIVFHAKATEIEINNCVMLLKGNGLQEFFGTYSRLNSFILKAIRYTCTVGSFKNIFSTSQPDAGRKGAIKFIGGNGLPRPNSDGLYASRWEDLSNSKMINYSRANDTNETHKLATRGEYAYSIEDNIPIISNGTNIADFMGNTTGGTYPYRIANNLYIDSGVCTVPTGNSLITVRYNRKKNGILLVTPTPYIDGANKTLFKLERNIHQDYLEKNDYAIFKAFQWDATNKVWSENITTSFDFKWVKFSE